MKCNATAVIFLCLVVVYLFNASFLISSLDTTQLQTQRDLQLQPPAPSNKISRNELSNNYAAVAKLPIYTAEMAAQAIRPAPWICGNPSDSSLDPITNQKPMFAFVHIYKTAGSTIRTFFQTYAYVCRKGWMCLIGCTKVKSSSIQSAIGWEPCRVKNVIDRNRILEEDNMRDRGRLYLNVNNTVMRENIDIIGGHFRIGTGDYILQRNSDDVYPVRHIVFLRDPMERFVSGILYERRREQDNFAEVIELIKKRVRGSRAAGDYWDKSLTYLLTPGQVEEFEIKKSELTHHKSPSLTAKANFAEVKSKAAIHNLFKYNTIVGMTERMDQSMELLKHVLLANASEDKVAWLEKHTNDTRSNESKKGAVSTSSVLDELKKDAEFVPVFEEYIKYEEMINRYASKMHSMQYRQLRNEDSWTIPSISSGSDS